MQRATQHGLNMWPDDEKQKEKMKSMKGLVCLGHLRGLYISFIWGIFFIMLLRNVFCDLSYNLQTIKEVRVFTDKNSL